MYGAAFGAGINDTQVQKHSEMHQSRQRQARAQRAKQQKQQQQHGGAGGMLGHRSMWPDALEHALARPLQMGDISWRRGDTPIMLSITPNQQIS